VSLYPLKVALSGLWREKWINLLSALTIGTGLFLITFALFFFFNVQKVVSALPDRFSVTVFLDDGVDEDRSREIISQVKKNRSVKKVTYISKEEAIEELRTAMRDSDYILEGLSENPLPASLELRLRKGSVTGESVRGLAMQLRDIEGVADVDYGERLLSVIQSIRKHFGTLGAVIVGSLSAGILFVCYSTVKILLYRKNEEIETLKLLGATKWFIRSPFIIEGGLLGLTGGAASSLAMFLLYHFLYFRLLDTVPLLKAVSVPSVLLTYTPAAGLFIGLAGAFTALGRIRF
jgi:cell division transport system permease protein